MMFLLANWRWIALGLALVTSAALGAYRMHTHDQIAYNALQVEFEAFRAKTAALGEAAKAVALAKEAADKEKKEKADAETAKVRRDLSGLYVAYRSLRDSRSGGSLLPQAAPGSASPDRAAFDRAALDRALSGFDRGVTGLLEEGDRAIADLDSARRWAQAH